MMAGNQKNIYVYDHFSSAEPLLMGTLYVSVNHILLNMTTNGWKRVV